MSFSEHVALTPVPVRLWVLWLTVAMVAAPVVLLLWRETRRTGLAVAAVNLANAAAMQALFAEAGFTRLLGLPHLVFWTPLLLLCVRRLQRGVAAAPPRVGLAAFAATVAVSLVFDAVDVARWLLGERAPMVAVPGDAG